MEKKNINSQWLDISRDYGGTACLTVRKGGNFRKIRQPYDGRAFNMRRILMRLEQLEYFVATADVGTISAAAQRLGISQPAISAAIRSLEEELGCPLLKRKNSGVGLTPLGRLTCEDARKVLDIIQEIRARGKSIEAGGSLSVCAQPLLSFHLTSRIVLPFKKMHPGVDVFVRNVPNSGIVEELKSGRSNIAVTLVALGLKIREQAHGMGYEIVPLYTDERKIFIGSGHPLAKKKTLSRDDLKTLRIAYYSHGEDHVSSRYAPWFGGEYRLANRDDILDLVIRNEAVFIQAGSMFRHDYRVRKGMMTEKTIPLPELDHSAPIVAVRSPELSPAELLFWAFLVENFAQGMACRQKKKTEKKRAAAAD